VDTARVTASIGESAVCNAWPGSGLGQVLKHLAERIKAERASSMPVASPPGRDDDSGPPNEPDSDIEQSGDESAVDARSEPDRPRDGASTGSTPAPSDLSESDPAREAAGSVETQKITGLRSALTVVTSILVAVGGLVGFLGYRSYEAHLTAQQRELFLQAGRQAAINLTTISYIQAEADVARILDSGTGAFHDDFQKRSQPFVDLIKQTQSISEGSVTAAGLESLAGDRAQVLVAVSVKTSNAGVPAPQPRRWRMRIDVQKLGDTAKVSDVQFVP
jgi:Mce-associated membrane protein